MQRYIILHSIILPHIRQQSARSISTTSVRSKSSLDIDSGSSTYSSWHFPITPDKGGLLPESSKAAQYRSEEREGGSAATLRSSTRSKWARPPTNTSISTSHPHLASHRRKPPDKGDIPGEIHDEPSRGRHEQTVHDALSKIVAIHIQPPIIVEPDCCDSAETSPSAYNSEKMTQTDISPPPRIQTRPLPPLPPTVHHLILRRQFRLAVFHIINTPSLASSRTLVIRVAEMLEIRGAGKLAAKLRGSFDITANKAHGRGVIGQGEAKTGMTEGQEGKMALGSDTKIEARWNGFWKIGPLPPIDFDDDHPNHNIDITGTALSPDSAGVKKGMSKGQTKQQAFTSYINAHLTFLLRRTALTKPLLPLDRTCTGTASTMDDLATPTNFSDNSCPILSHPAPNLRQLRDLLRSIQILERKYQFVPDRITANIILGCWLRCAQAPHPLSDPLRIRVDEAGNERVSEKEDSKRIFGGKEVMALHKILRGVIERGVSDLENRYRRVAELAARLEKLDQTGAATPVTAVPSSSQASTSSTMAVEKIKELLHPLATAQPGEISWTDHIKPLAETIKRALRKTGDKAGVYEVIMWEKGVYGRLREIRIVRAKIRRLTGLTSAAEDEGEGGGGYGHEGRAERGL